MPEFLPYGRQDISPEDLSEVSKTLQSDWLTTGPMVKAFEDALAAYVGARFAVAVCNGTAALHLACLALELAPEHQGVTSPITFLASANCLLYCGATPVFADIEPDTYNISPSAIEKKISPVTRVIIPVHLAGQSCNMEEIASIAREKKLFIIEDACHALGAEYNGEKVGCCRYSDMTVFSFHPVKHITTGEGGAITTNDPELYQKLLVLRSHGMVKLPDDDRPWYYEMRELGYNFRITDIQCALGLSQLKRLDVFVERRRHIVAQYNEAFQNISWLTLPAEALYARSSYHLYILQINYEAIGSSRIEVMNRLKEKGIGSQVHYIPVFTQPFYQRRFSYLASDYPNAMAYYEKTLSIPLYPKMKDSDVQRVIQSVLDLKK